MSEDTDLIRQEIWESLRDKGARDAFVASHLSNNIGAQIFSMREGRGWSQDKLAAEVGMAQPRISVLEGGYDSYSLRTLKRIASAFDVAVVVRFVPFSELVDWTANLSEERLAPVEFGNDNLPADEEPADESAVAEPSLVLYGSAETLPDIATSALGGSILATSLTGETTGIFLDHTLRHVWGSSYAASGAALNDIGLSNATSQGFRLDMIPHHGMRPNERSATHGYTVAPPEYNTITTRAVVQQDLEQQVLRYLMVWNSLLSQGDLYLSPTPEAPPQVFTFGESAYETDFQASGLLNPAGFAGRSHAAGWLPVPKRDLSF